VDQPTRRREVTAVEWARALLDRIQERDPETHALITITPDLALSDARRVDTARSRRALPLDGLPVVLKDNIDVAGIVTTAGSRFFERNFATEDARVVWKLRREGAVILGKANLHEFAFGVTTDNPFFGTCRNPWDPERIPGGSSGGSAVAIALDFCVGALGTDTGGSVRLPAAFTGVTGLRPTSGRISTRGVFPVCRSLDTVGPMSRSVSDLRRLLRSASGYDDLDPWAVRPSAALAAIDETVAVRGLKIGLPMSYFFDGMHPEIQQKIDEAVNVFRDLGFEIVEVEVADLHRANEMCSRLTLVEAFSLHEQRLREQPSFFGDDVRRRLSLAEGISSAEYVRITNYMMEWRRKLSRILAEKVDMLLTPMSRNVAPRIGELDSIAAATEYARYTRPWSLGNLPSLSIPCGVTRAGMPVGLQLAAAPWHEAQILCAAAAYQEVTNWHALRPRVGGK